LDTPLSSSNLSLQMAAEKPLPTFMDMTRQRSCSYSSTALRSWLSYQRQISHPNSLSIQSFVQQRPTLSPVQTIAVALSLVQYRTCSVPELRPGKKSAICVHVKFFVSFSSTSKASSPGENLTLGPLGFAAGSGMPGQLLPGKWRSCDCFDFGEPMIL
jgi:hypothetical protein